MSAGKFEDGFYELNSGEIARIRVQEETKSLTLDGTANAYATGPSTLPTAAKVSGGRRSLGINARLVRVQFTAGPPSGYKAEGVVALPWFNPTTWEALEKGNTGTYLSTAVKLVGKTAEAVR